MGSLGTALAIVISVNVVLWLGQVAVLHLNPDLAVNSREATFYHCENGLLGAFEANNCQGTSYVLRNNATGDLPGGGGQIQISSGNVFTDTYSAVSNWVSSAGSYITLILSGPSNFLQSVGVPSEMAFGIGVIWYGITLLLVVAFFMGARDV